MHVSDVCCVWTNSGVPLQTCIADVQHVLQILSGLQGEVMLGGAACLARQGFLDTAQDLLTQHRAAVGPTHLPSLQAQLRLRIAQVPHLLQKPPCNAALDLLLYIYHHHIASHRIALHRIASHHITSPHVTSPHVTLHVVLYCVISCCVVLCCVVLCCVVLCCVVLCCVVLCCVVLYYIHYVCWNYDYPLLIIMCLLPQSVVMLLCISAA